MYIHIYRSTHMHIYAYMHIHMCIYIYIYVHIHTQLIFACIYIYICICYRCVYIYIERLIPTQVGPIENGFGLSYGTDRVILVRLVHRKGWGSRNPTLYRYIYIDTYIHMFSVRYLKHTSNDMGSYVGTCMNTYI